jgi:two-component system, NtrC family, response regulator AtoC
MDHPSCMARPASSDRDLGNGAEVWALGNGGTNGAAASHAPEERYNPFLDGSPQMRAIGTVIENVADTDVTVLIRGESGVGKDLVARATHAAIP